MKPTANSTVAEIKAFLDAHGVSYPSSALKGDLLALVESTPETAAAATTDTVEPEAVPDHEPEEQREEVAPEAPELNADDVKAETGTITPETPKTSAQTIQEARTAAKYTKDQLINDMNFGGAMRDLLKVALSKNQTYTYGEAKQAVDELKRSLF